MVRSRTSCKYIGSGARVGNPGRSRFGILACSVLPGGVARAVLALSALIISAEVRKGAEGERPEDVVEMVIRAMAHNYEQIKTADVTIEVVSEEDPSSLPARLRAPDPEPKQEGNVYDVVKSRPRIMKHVVIRGEDLKYDEDRLDGSSESVLYKQGRVSRYVPATKQMNIRRPEDLHRPVIDPRQVGTVNTSVGLADLLRSSELLDAKLIDRGDSTTVARVVVRSVRDRVEYEFASAMGFLPTRETVTRADGSVKSCLEVDYQDVLEGKAKFLKESVETFFPPGATKTPAAKGWHQRIRHTVTDLRINQEVDDSVFEIHVPVGTVVVDNITKKWSVYGKESRETGSSSRLLIWYGAGIGLLVLLAVVIYLRSR